jgi:hypothetical protein
VTDAGLESITLTEIGGSACRVRRGNSYSCDGPWNGLEIDLGDGSDRVEMWSAQPATVVAGAGAKNIETGPGADRIYVRNGVGDQVVCGDGADLVIADLGEVVDPSCETVERAEPGDPTEGATPDGGSTGGGDGQQTGGANSGAPAIGVPIGIVLPDHPLAVASPSSVVANLGCSRAALDDCRGELEIFVFELRGKRTAHAARGRHTAWQRRIGKRGYFVGRGKKSALPVRVVYRGHYALVSRRRRARSRLKVTQRDSAGKVIGVTSTETWLPLEKKWSRRRGHRR